MVGSMQGEREQLSAVAAGFSKASAAAYGPGEGPGPFDALDDSDVGTAMHGSRPATGPIRTAIEGDRIWRWRVVGPGKLERDYQSRIADLEQRVMASDERARALAGELEWSERVERGAQRLLDHLESERARDRLAVGEFQRNEKRLILALGGLQKENEILRGELARLAAGSARSPARLAERAGDGARRAVGPWAALRAWLRRAGPPSA